MTRPFSSRRRALGASSLVLALLAAGASACATSPIPKAPTAYALSSRVDWTHAELHAGKDLHGRDVDVIDVRGGELLRLETNGRVEIGERVRAGEGFAESWTEYASKDGVVMVRASLLATALLVPHGSVVRAHVGRGLDPGYAWYDLETEVIAWADGPLPAPFPAIAPEVRIDRAGFDALDHALAASVAHAKDHDEALDEARAIRRVAGLRAVRALRPPEGFPYFYDRAPKLVSTSGAAPVATRTRDGRVEHQLTEQAPLTYEVDGPALLHVFTRAERRAQSDALELEVREDGRLRARSAAIVPAGTREAVARDDENASELVVRRAIVHVPPGKHTYVVHAKGAPAWVEAMVADPSIHFQHAMLGTKSEAKLLDRASEACEKANAPAICAFALALAGHDAPNAKADPDDALTYGAALAASPADARALATTLAEGGPRDPVFELEARAARGDPASLGALGHAALDVVDDGVRDAWFRGTVYGTEWRTSAPDAPRTWTAMLASHAGPGSACEGGPAPTWTELARDDAEFATTTYRGAPALELVAAASCDGGAPLTLEVDGQSLTPNPSTPIARWHVLVKGATARARRLDARGGHVFAIRPADAACGVHFGHIGAPSRVADRPELKWGHDVTAPGVEVWLHGDATSGSFTVVEAAAASPRRVRIEALAQRGFTALDERGERWTRVVRVALPAWAVAGVRVEGDAHVAVRPIVRAPRAVADDANADGANGLDDASRLEPKPLDEELLVRLSRAILAAAGEARGKAYLARAVVLAEGGAVRAALEDARAAKALGVKGPAGEDAIAWVRARIRKRPHTLSLPAGTSAYGVEPDFDDAAPRCATSSDGPRGRLAAIAEALDVARSAQKKVWDASLAARAIEAVRLSPENPRGAAILAWALAGSRWQTPREVDGGALRVQRPHESSREGAIDPDGDLRARVGTGLPFPRASYATITEQRPAKAALPSIDGARARVEWACVARSPAEALGLSCPIQITVGDGAPARPSTGDDGVGRYELPVLPAKGKQHDVTISMGPSPGRFAAIARIVYDREVPGTTKVDGVGWVLLPPGLQYRFLLKNGEQIATKVGKDGIVRVDALAEAEERPHVTVVVDGVEHPVSTDGAPLVLVSHAGGPVTVKSTGGAATVLLAERVAKPTTELDPDEVEADPARAEAVDAEPRTAPTTTARLDANDPIAMWRDEVSRSNRPLTTLEENLGTITARSEVRYGNYRDGNLVIDPDQTDGYFEQAIGYRRRIEAIDLWIGAGALERVRDTGGATAGVAGLLYEEIGRLRLAGWFDYFQQDLGFQVGRSYRPRAFVEYSVRVTPDVFLLPRLGYDGFYGNFARKPASLKGVDDDVFNSYRFERSTFAFAQLLGWWVPYVNDIFYLRGRATWDWNAGALDHVAVRPGAFFAIGDAELGAFADATFYRQTSVPFSANVTETTWAGYALFNFWLAEQSVDLQPGIGARARTRDGAWELFALVNVFGSFRRGLRDFTSFELNFPEPLGGGVPWRGGMR